MEIRHYPDPSLKQPASKVADPGEVTDKLEEMVRLMQESKGVGLAATQVGDGRRFFIINVEGQPGKKRCSSTRS